MYHGAWMTKEWMTKDTSICLVCSISYLCAMSLVIGAKLYLTRMSNNQKLKRLSNSDPICLCLRKGRSIQFHFFMILYTEHKSKHNTKFDNVRITTGYIFTIVSLQKCLISHLLWYDSSVWVPNIRKQGVITPYPTHNSKKHDPLSKVYNFLKISENDTGKGRFLFLIKVHYNSS